MKRQESSKVIAGRKGRENVQQAAPDTDSSTVHSTHSSEAAEVSWCCKRKKQKQKQQNKNEGGREDACIREW